MMPAQQGTLNVLGDSVFAAMSLPVSALPAIDDDGDGRLSQRELDAHRTELQEQLARRLRFYDGDQPGRQDLVMVMAEPDERNDASAAGSTHFMVLMKAGFAAPPRALRIETDLFGQDAGERQLTLKATRGEDAEAAVLTPTRAGHQFFRPAWQVLPDYIATGVLHVLQGADHLLFLLTIVVAAAGWRYWLGVLTSFTVAHSITLALALYGWVQVPAAVVEPLIAASIVLMALLNLWQREAVLLQRVAIVFGCGLLHGLGFASSLADMGLHGAWRLTSMIGFNLGIELGQLLFLAALLALLAVLRTLARTRVPRGQFDARPSAGQAASLLASLVGGFWFLERIGAFA